MDQKITASELSPRHLTLLVNFLDQLEREQQRLEAQEQRQRHKREESQRVNREAADVVKKKQDSCPHKRWDGSSNIFTWSLSDGNYGGFCPLCGKEDFSQDVLSALPAGASKPTHYTSSERWEWFRTHILMTLPDQLSEELAQVEAALQPLPEYQRKLQIEAELKEFHRYEEIGKKHVLKSLREYLGLEAEAREVEDIRKESQELQDRPPDGLALDVMESPTYGNS